ncbi:sensor histidine kinase [Kineosporia rhizophila]|uniref:sensor histidine kinase n=1 Tax=Kineosporia TaxID=49184 RepID=UPI001E4F191C|nr:MULTISPECIES: sensor histidine kinase [Kineosporia]MCE0538505.1 sensor histidine kinase [Kineosporia rhizophila]GLY18358.1 two-component sensor histidine kinase [Kineosporia sp. NBRC 101677]
MNVSDVQDVRDVHAPVGRLLARTRREWTSDVLLTLLVMATVVLRSDVPPVSDTAAAIEMFLVLPLVLRRVFPSTVFVVLLVLFGTLPLWSTVSGPNLAVLVALYTVAANQSRVRASVAALALDITYVVLVSASPRVNWVDALLVCTAATAAALALGLWIGTRRSYLAELRDRAERLERERDQQHELAVATERARMTREMHDIVAHHLTVVVALSDAAARTAPRSPEQAAEVMRQVSATGRQALAETRRVLNGSNGSSEGEGDGRAPVPDLRGIDDLLEGVRTAGLPVSYQVAGDPGKVAIEPGVQLTVYRLVQEALTNTMKHAGAGATATVRLEYGDSRIAVEITDDGGGRRAAAAPSRGPGRGLTGMRERVHAYGGEVDSGPRHPAGWRVSARIAAGPQGAS